MALIKEPEMNSLPDIFEQSCAGQQTARLTVSYPDGDGVFYFQNGQLIEAQFGEFNGEEAVRQAVGLRQEDYRIDLDVAVPPRTIFAGWADLMNGTIQAPEVMDSKIACDERENQTDNFAGKDRLTLRNAHNSVDSVNLPRVEAPAMSASKQRTVSATAPPQTETVSANCDHGRLHSSLAATGILQSGLVIDEDGVIVSEVGEGDGSFAQTAFMIAGLESLVSAQFDLGQCDGALLDRQGATTLVTSARGLSCAFAPVPRTPVARAFNETRRALENPDGE
jgi:hypothetical protein